MPLEKTSAEEIYKMFLFAAQDPKIKNIFESNPEIGEDMLQHFLMTAISKFYNCIKPIMEFNTETNEFPCILDLREKNILKDWMVIAWLDFVTNDVLQINWTLNDLDFKHTSEGQNLTAKSNYSDKLREKVVQDMVDYGYKNAPFKEWAVGNYGI